MLCGSSNLEGTATTPLGIVPLVSSGEANHMTALLEIKNVRKVFGSGRGFFRSKRQVVALENFSLVIPDDVPTFTAIAGESGSGKTTLANLILGFLAPSSGQVLHRGQD